ncbi:MAG: hypothetical protein K2H99_03870 [Paramuribaculum sp.]|nr:hypothetical protein [Paramuribaculum sp.]
MTNSNDIELLFKTHYAQMYRLAVTLLHDDDLARDIVHDVFASLLDRSPDLIVTGGYLLKAVRNRCLNHIRDCEIHQRIANRYFLVPASDNDLKMMRISDVKSVEYLEYPADARFQGNRFVINFRLIQYEYGGYVKALGTENFIANSGFLQANARFVKNKMTYDIMGYGYYLSNNHFGVDLTETFNLPQEDGKIKSFQRESQTETARYRKSNYQTSIRALY